MAEMRWNRRPEAPTRFDCSHGPRLALDVFDHNELVPEFVAKHRVAWPVNLMCETLGVSQSGFYA